MNEILNNIGNFRTSESGIRASVYGCSYYSMYTPIFSIFKASGSRICKDYSIYHHLTSPSIFKKHNYNQLISFFLERNRPLNYENKQGKYCIRKGIITDENLNILLCVCFKNYKKIINIDNVITNNDLIVVVNKQFEDSLIYKHLHKNDFFADIDLLSTKNVKKYCFNSGNIIPKFKNIVTMQEYFKNVNNLMR